MPARGRVPRASHPSEVADFFRAVDVFVAPPWRTDDWEEQSPRTVIEALMSGSLVVGTRAVRSQRWWAPRLLSFLSVMSGRSQGRSRWPLPNPRTMTGDGAHVYTPSLTTAIVLLPIRRSSSGRPPSSGVGSVPRPTNGTPRLRRDSRWRRVDSRTFLAVHRTSGTAELQTALDRIRAQMPGVAVHMVANSVHDGAVESAPVSHSLARYLTASRTR